MYKNNNRFKKLKLKREKEENSIERKSPMQRQRFTSTIKNVTEDKKKKLNSEIGFHSANKIHNYNRGEKRKKEKNHKESTEQVKFSSVQSLSRVQLFATP